jgi:hypothetical protein
MNSESISFILEALTVALTATGVLVTIIAAFKSGILHKVDLNTSRSSKHGNEEAHAIIQAVAEPWNGKRPYETEQLSRYYAQVLGQSKSSFWFSLIFASVGFFVIIIAGFKYTSTSSGGAILQLLSGVIMDAVAALFFVQSKSAQKSMAEFFDKLRKDRQQVESRNLCESISDPFAKDALKIQLALRYAEIEQSDEVSKGIIQAYLKPRSVESQASHASEA